MQLNAKAREFLRQYHNGLRESYGATDSRLWGQPSILAVRVSTR